jgi:outer membrane receptor protein involved in Fe transport
MRPTLVFHFLLFCLCSLSPVTAQPTGSGAITGRLVDAGGQPTPGAAVSLLERATDRVLRSVSTDPQGEFAFNNVAIGDYTVSYGSAQDIAFATVSTATPSVDLGALTPAMDPAIMLQKLEVSARTDAFYNSIDRKVYNVGKDVTSATGSASDLLQNIPSIQVDVEGEVSLRGNENVTILINGKSSAMMSRNRAEALEQMSADRIERVEVITNPSAKYKPDGTGGIINIILKQEGNTGWSATARVNVSESDRYNASLSGTYNPGRFSLFGSASFRRDNRPRSVSQQRIQLDGAGNVTSSSSQSSAETWKMESERVEFGGTYHLGDNTELGASFTVGTREMDRYSLQQNTTRNAAGGTARDFERERRGGESDEDFEVNLTFDHTFQATGAELTVELDHETDSEEGEDLFTNRYRTPLQPDELERTQNKESEDETELTADYTRELSAGAKLEAGYALSAGKTDLDTTGAFFDAPTNAWVINPLTTNRFIYKSVVNAFYATYARPFGDFGAMGGLRFEHTDATADQATASIVDENDYARLYPSLHLTYDLTPAHQLQLSYSHRVQRPDSWDLNPFPQYDDPLNLYAGNPDLEPEDIHSIEAGWQYRQDDTTYLASIYRRYRYNGISDVTRLINGTTLFTTRENLATSRSTGIELGATTRVREKLALNLSANIYREQIEAGNLGFTNRRTTTAWDAKLNANWELSKSWVIQATSSYRARRLTPQGERRPTHLTNLGARFNLPNRKTSLVLTVSDVFESFKDRTVLDTPTLRNETVRTRSARIIFVGFIHHFGKSSKENGEELPFDDGDAGGPGAS